MESANQSAFSIVEVALALAIASVGLVTILAMAPQAMETSRSSADRTAIGVVLEDIQENIRGLPLVVGIPEKNRYFYDIQGRATIVDPENKDAMPPFFRVDIELVEISEPATLENAESLLAVAATIWWPLDEKGEPRDASNPRLRFSRPVNTLTGPDWQAIDSEYTPRVEY